MLGWKLEGLERAGKREQKAKKSVIEDDEAAVKLLKQSGLRRVKTESRERQMDEDLGGKEHSEGNV